MILRSVIYLTTCDVGLEINLQFRYLDPIFTHNENLYDEIHSFVLGFLNYKIRFQLKGL